MEKDGVEFAFIKASQGKLPGDPAGGAFTDPQFHRNMKEAKAVGIPVGVYHYLTADTVAEAEAEAACENIRGKMARMNVEVDVSAIPGGQPVYYYFISVE